MGDNSSAGNYEQFVEQLSEEEKLDLLIQLSKSLKNTRRNARRKNQRQKGPATETTLSTLVKPMRKTLTLEDLIQEQNYQGGNQKRFDQKAAKLNIMEPIEELLAQLAP